MTKTNTLRSCSSCKKYHSCPYWNWNEYELDDLEEFTNRIDDFKERLKDLIGEYCKEWKPTKE